MCRSSCINMFEICGFPEQMWRCGESEYFNSMDSKEKMEISSGSEVKAEQQVRVGSMGEEHR